jgi:hypothetical protein
MEKCIRDNGKMIRNMDMESIYGMMGGSIGENGRKIGNMGLDTFRVLLIRRKGKESG